MPACLLKTGKDSYILSQSRSLSQYNTPPTYTFMYYLMGIWIYVMVMTQGDRKGKKRLLKLTEHKEGEMKQVLYLG